MANWLPPASWGFKSCYVVFELFVFQVFTDCKALWITKRKALYKCILLLYYYYKSILAPSPRFHERFYHVVVTSRDE